MCLFILGKASKNLLPQRFVEKISKLLILNTSIKHESSISRKFFIIVPTGV